VSEAHISHEELERFVQTLVERRDEALADAKSAMEEGGEGSGSVVREYGARATAYRMTLSSLHTWSNGAYGQSLEQQKEAGQ
jgi:hypothetical protein